MYEESTVEFPPVKTKKKQKVSKDSKTEKRQRYHKDVGYTSGDCLRKEWQEELWKENQSTKHPLLLYDGSSREGKRLY